MRRYICKIRFGKDVRVESGGVVVWKRLGASLKTELLYLRVVAAGLGFGGLFWS